jgi:hypothetical protein
MFEGLIVVSLGCSLGGWLWVQAVKENQQELAQQIEAQGGINSPWLQTELRGKVEASPEFWTAFESKYSADERNLIERNPLHGLDTSPAMPLTVSGASPAMSQPVSMYEATTATQPAVEPVATTTHKTGCDSVVEPAGCDWLTANKPFFPVAVPPATVQSFADRKALIQATYWIGKALDAGISQNKIVTQVFEKSKGTAEYNRIVEIVKELKE